MKYTANRLGPPSDRPTDQGHRPTDRDRRPLTISLPPPSPKKVLVQWDKADEEMLGKLL